MMQPCDHNAECAVLGALILDNRKLAEIGNIVTADDFATAANAKIFEAIRRLSDEGKPADEVTVAQMSGLPQACEYVVKLFDATPTTENIASYARIVRDKSIARKLVAIANSMKASAHNEPPAEVIESTSQKLFELCRSQEDRRIVHAADAARGAMKRIEDAYRNPNRITGVRTGFADLDEMLGGMQAADLVIIAARPGMGKTALVLNLLTGASANQKRCLLFELEMSESQLSMRAIASSGRISLQRIKRGALGETDFARIARGANEYGQSRMVIDETPNANLADIRSVARMVSFRGGLDLIAIDYLQLMSAEKDRDNREREVAEISRGLKRIAKEFGVPVIALSQLNRKLEERSDKRPMMSDLRESGAIEQDADVIAFLYRDEVYDADTDDKGIAEVIIAKQRNGPTGTVKLRFDADTQRFDRMPQ